MTRYVLSPLAQADIDDIWDYSADRWNEDQAQRYIEDIRRAVETVARDPRRGRSCDQIRRGYYKFSVNAHICSIGFRLLVTSRWCASFTRVWISAGISNLRTSSSANRRSFRRDMR
jgi:toxin ParE1/3/4